MLLMIECDVINCSVLWLLLRGFDWSGRRELRVMFMSNYKANEKVQLNETATLLVIVEAEISRGVARPRENQLTK